MLDRKTPFIRSARRDDIPALSSLIVAALSEFLRAAPLHIVKPHIESSRDIGSQWSKGHVLVAEVAGEPAGAGVYYRAGQLGMGLPVDWAGMRTLVVSPAARGRGLGRLLVRHFIERARTDGAAALGLHTSGYMQSAIRIYEAAGFVRCPGYDLSAAKILGTDAALGDVALLAYRHDLASG
jgi:GNAT superfamily N-acetyltransferase